MKDLLSHEKDPLAEQGHQLRIRASPDHSRKKKKKFRLREKGKGTLKFCLDHAFSLLTPGWEGLYFQTSCIIIKCLICVYVYKVKQKCTLSPSMTVTLLGCSDQPLRKDKYIWESHLLNTEILQAINSSLVLTDFGYFWILHYF